MSRSVQVPVLELPDVDRHSLISYRQRRLLEQMELAGVDAMVLMNPVSLRYAADWREYALFQAHIPTCYLVLRSDGSSVMFGAYADEHDWIGEFRPGHHPNVFDSGTDLAATRDLEIHLGRPADVLADRRVAVTFAPVPGFRRLEDALSGSIAELHPWPWLRRPHGGPIGSFSAWRKRAR